MEKSSAGARLEDKSIKNQLRDAQHNLYHANNQLAAKGAEIARLQATNQDQEDRIKELESRCNGLSSQNIHLHAQLNDLSMRLQKTSAELDRIIKESKEEFRKMESAYKSSIHTERSQKNILEEKLKNFQFAHAKSNEELQTLQKKFSEYQEKIQQIENEKNQLIAKNTRSYTIEIQKLKNEQQSHKNKAASLEEKIKTQSNIARSERLNYKKEILHLQTNLKNTQKIIDKLNARHQKEIGNLAYHKNEKITSLQNDQQKLRAQIDQQNQKNSSSSDEIKYLNAKLALLNTNIQEIEEQFKLEQQRKKNELAAIVKQSEQKIAALNQQINAIPKPAPPKPAPGKYDFSKLPADFNPRTYRKLNEDLKKLTITELKEHYLECGKKEARLYLKPLVRPDHNFTNQNNIKLYQIYYDQKHTPHILNHATPYLNNNPTIYFESAVMCDIFNKKDYVDGEYIGVLSWKASLKIRNVKTLSEIDSAISAQKYDIYTFNNKSFLGFTRPHRGSGSRYDVQAWRALMQLTQHMQSKKIWPQVSEKELDKNMLRIYCNYFIAKKEIWEDFVGNFMIPAIQEMKNDEQMKNIATAAHKAYSMPLPQSFIDVTGYDYYPMAPFMLERLINVYIVMRNLKVGFVL